MKNGANAERSISAIVYWPSRNGPFAPVRKTGADGFEFGEQGLQRGHADSESTNALHRQAKSSGAVGQSGEFHAPLYFRLAWGYRRQDWAGSGYSGNSGADAFGIADAWAFRPVLDPDVSLAVSVACSSGERASYSSTACTALNFRLA